MSILRNCLVEADFGRIKPVSESLKELTDELEIIADESIENHIAGTKNVWKEDIVAVFLTKVEIVKSKISSEYKILDGIINDITGTSDNLYMAERNNIDMGLARRY